MSKINYFKSRIEATFSPMDFTKASQANPDRFLVVDVRNAPPHIIKQKIAGAKHLPLAQLAERLDELPKDKTIVVYCWETWCNMAAKAAVILLENGYDVIELTGGIVAWLTMEFPVESLE